MIIISKMKKIHGQRFQISVHQHHLVLHALAGHVQQLLQPLHLSSSQRKSFYSISAIDGERLSDQNHS